MCLLCVTPNSVSSSLRGKRQRPVVTGLSNKPGLCPEPFTAFLCFLKYSENGGEGVPTGGTWPAETIPGAGGLFETHRSSACLALPYRGPVQLGLTRKLPACCALAQFPREKKAVEEEIVSLSVLIKTVICHVLSGSLGEL